MQIVNEETILMLPLATLIQENTPEVQQKKLINGFRAFAQRQNLFEIDINSRVTWILRFLQFHNKQHPTDLNQSDIETFISNLAIEYNYSPLIQSNAATALTYLYHDFLQINVDKFQYIQVKTRRGFMDRYSKSQCLSVVQHLKGISRLMAELAVYCRLKLNEVTNLKLTDVNIKKSRIKIRTPNGDLKFSSNIPIHLSLELRIQMMRVRQLMQIKTRQFSSSYQKSVSKLSNKARSPSTKLQDEFLFPVSNTDSPQISSQKMQLTLLKNDIQIAIKRYQRSMGNRPNNNSALAKPIEVSPNFVNQLSNTSPLAENSAPETDHQTTFNFAKNRKQSIKLMGAV